MRLIHTLRRLYNGHSPAAMRFRYALLGFVLLSVLYIVVTSFFYIEPLMRPIDMLLGVVILTELLLRVAISERRWQEMLSPYNWIDAAVIFALLLPIGHQWAFVRALRLLRSYSLLGTLREEFYFFRRNEDIIFSAINLAIFIFVMTELVFVTQVNINPNIRNFVDALYFTVTTLTTTGFGDITMVGMGGRMLAVMIMILGVSLFLRLLQTLFRPRKVFFPCPSCGLNRHELDAVHCKHCGITLAIPDEGSD